MWEELCINGYLFNTPEEYQEAKKEEEVIRYIKSKTNVKNYDSTLKLYNTLIEKNTFHTPVGVGFLHELYLILAANKEHDKPKPIVLNDIIKQSNGKIIDSNKNDSKVRNVVELYKSKYKNAKIVIFFLIILLAALFIITFTGDNSPLIDEETKLQDKYASWEEELTLREQNLQEQLNKLNGVDSN